MVKQGMTNMKWIDHIFPPETTEEVKEFVKLWEAISSVQLNDSLEDELRWRWTQDGEYSAKSAYLIQSFFQNQNLSRLEGQSGTQITTGNSLYAECTPSA